MSEEKKLPKGWVETTLGEICSRPQYGWTTKASSHIGSIKLLRTTDISGGLIDWDTVPYCTEIPDNLDTYKLTEGDIVISRTGSVGVSYLLTFVPPIETVFASYLIRFHPFEEAEPKYIAYYLQTPTYWAFIQEQSSGIALANVNARKLETFEIPLAPLPEQQRIVAVLEQHFTRLDAVVTTLQHNKAMLKRARASVLKAAVEGKLTEAWRAKHLATESTHELLQRILVERRKKWEAEQLAKMEERGVVPKDDKWKEGYKEPVGPEVEGLPKLPEGWCWTNLGQCFEVCVGATPRRTEEMYWGGDIPWVSSGEIQFCRIRETREYITQLGLSNSSTQINPVSSVLLGMIGEGRTRGQVAILDIEACNNQNSAAIWVSQTPIAPEYIYYWLWSQYEVTRQKGSGNSQPALNRTRVEQINFPLPSITEQQQIVAEVEQRLSIISQLEAAVEASLKRIERLRQSILKKAFAGQLVPQDPNDEPASILLERIREERKGREQAEQQRRKEERMKKAQNPGSMRAKKTGKQRIPLMQVLVEAKKPLPPDDLFRRAGLRPDSIEDVEAFFEEIHETEDRQIKVVRPDATQVFLEAISE